MNLVYVNVCFNPTVPHFPGVETSSIETSVRNRVRHLQKPQSPQKPLHNAQHAVVSILLSIPPSVSTNTQQPLIAAFHPSASVLMFAINPKRSIKPYNLSCPLGSMLS